VKPSPAFLKKIWNDPVFSNLIANGIMAIIIYLFYKFTSQPGKTEPIQSSASPKTYNSFHSMAPVHPAMQDTGHRMMLVHSGYIILFAVVLFFAIRMIIGLMTRRKQ
jgi:hypothetical protein